MSTTDETRLPGDVPLWEIPGWREEYGVRAGVTGRGSRDQPFDLGLWTSNPVGDVMRRWRQFRAAIPECPAAVLAHQVHGTTVLLHRRLQEGLLLQEGADGHVTQQGGALLLVTVADCIPIYLVAPRHRAIALLHAGWRGTAAGILNVAMNLFDRCLGIPAHDIVMHAGVGISGDSYEVGSEVIQALGEDPDGPGPWRVDLRARLAAQATASGIGTVTVSGRCSARDDADFFSHRRSRGADGRSVAYLGLVSGR